MVHIGNLDPCVLFPLDFVFEQSEVGHHLVDLGGESRQLLSLELSFVEVSVSLDSVHGLLVTGVLESSEHQEHKSSFVSVGDVGNLSVVHPADRKVFLKSTHDLLLDP